MTKCDLYVDTEFSNFLGELISIGVVAVDIETGLTVGLFYAVLNDFDDVAVHPWVNLNVLPLLHGTQRLTRPEARRLLAQFLDNHSGGTIYADWPEDLAHLLNLLCMEGGNRFGPSELNLKLISTRDFKVTSLLPHHALRDAMALADAHVEYTRSKNDTSAAS